VQGESAVFELERDGELFAEMWLEGISLDAHGAARIADAEVVIRFRADRDANDGAAGVDFDELVALLAEGRAWLLENEQGRKPE